MELKQSIVETSKRKNDVIANYYLPELAHFHHVINVLTQRMMAVLTRQRVGGFNVTRTRMHGSLVDSPHAQSAAPHTRPLTCSSQIVTKKRPISLAGATTLQDKQRTPPAPVGIDRPLTSAHFVRQDKLFCTL